MAEAQAATNKSSSSLLVLFLIITTPILASFWAYRLHHFDAAPIPDAGLAWRSGILPNHHDAILRVMETVGDGLLPGPEDLAYDPETKFIYASCRDGWIKRVKLSEPESNGQVEVEDWVRVSGRPLGLALGPDKELYVADADNGLLKVTPDGGITLLTDEAEGLKFKLTNGVDVAENGIIYFTDATHKYHINNYLFDFLEGRPYGRLLSFNPSTNKTELLLQDLYFPNGVTLSPKQDFLVYCETTLRSCSKYYIHGNKKGTTELYVDRLPGYPDNIKYDGEGNFLIGLGSGYTFFWDMAFKYPMLRKILVMLLPYINIPNVMKDGGIVAVNLAGELTALYTDHDLPSATSGIKIGNHLDYGSLVAGYISRINLASFEGNNVQQSSDVLQQ